VLTATLTLVLAPFTATWFGTVHVACAGAPVQLTATFPVNPFCAFTFSV